MQINFNEKEIEVLYFNEVSLLCNHLISWALNFVVWRGWACSWTHTFVDFKLWEILLTVGELIFCKDLKLVNKHTHEIHEIKFPMNENDFTVCVLFTRSGCVLAGWCAPYNAAGDYTGYLGAARLDFWLLVDLQT